MGTSWPSFRNAPVIERVIGLQFQPLTNFTAAHAGAYWNRFLGEKDWTSIQEAPRLDDAFEKFGDERQWTQGHSIVMRAGIELNRTQFFNRMSTRMLQVQDSRLILNWKPGDDSYPRFTQELVPEFMGLLETFTTFVENEELGNIKGNQWEVTYVNSIPSGSLWNTVADWPKIIPHFSLLGHDSFEQSIDGFQGEWQLAIGEQRGRLHITIKHARLGQNEKETLLLTLNARGPIDDNSLDECLSLGHRSIVQTFAHITSPEAHKTWGREN